MSHEQFSELRRLLSLSPSLKLWEQLLDLLDEWPQDPSRDVALDYCEAHLEHWPDGLRPRMLRQGKSDSKPPATKLGRLLFSDMLPTELLKRLEKEGFPSYRSWAFQHMPNAARWKQLEDAGAFFQMEGFYGTPQEDGLQEQLEAIEMTFESNRLKRWALSTYYVFPVEKLLKKLQRDSFASLEHLFWNLPSYGGSQNLSNHLPSLENVSFLPALKTINLRRGESSSVNLSSLFTSGRLQSLKHLVLFGLRGGLPTWSALTQSSVWESLEELELSHCLNTAEEFESVFCSPVPPRLRTLTLANNHNVHLPRALLREMEKQGWFTSLKSLTLNSVKLRQSYEPLSKQPWPELEELSFQGCELNPTVLGWWFEKKNLPKLRKLSFNNTPLSKKALSLIADCPWMPSVEVLEINECKLSDEGLATLLESNNLNGLREVSLERNDLTNDSWATLQDSGLLEQLNALYLNRNQFSKGTKKAMRKRPCVELHHISAHPVEWFNKVFLYED